MTFNDHFSGVSSAYAAFRPRYPAELFEWIASVTERHERAVDLGTGSGQAAIALAEHYAHVDALDPSSAQIAAAIPEKGVHYRVAPSDATGLPDRSVDLITAAAAAHWFPHEAFHREAYRIARPGAAIVLWTYREATVTPAIDAVLAGSLYAAIEAFWPPERRYVQQAYRTLPFPFPEIAAPSFAIQEKWSVERYFNYFRTWSSVQRYVQHHGRNPVDMAADRIREAWGPEERIITWPLAIRAGRIEA